MLANFAVYAILMIAVRIIDERRRGSIPSRALGRELHREPDAGPETGLGKWTLRSFTDTLRTGRHMGRGRAILPPMPIPMYKHFTHQDMDAIFSCLRTIPAVTNRCPNRCRRRWHRPQRISRARSRFLSQRRVIRTKRECITRPVLPVSLTAIPSLQSWDHSD